MLRRTSRQSVSVRHRGDERGFKLGLPLVVEGPDIEGSLFREETTLSFISHVGALFTLQSPVALGTRVKLALSLPDKLSEGKRLRLVIKGTIVDIDSGKPSGEPPRVAIRLENRYVVEAGPS